MVHSKSTIWIIAAVFWTMLIALIACGATHVSYNAIIEMAEVEAQASFNKDVAYRKWASMHGGVYVPVTDKTQPNQYLAHISERDIITPSGKKLTLVNPAYMTRQVFELYNSVTGIKGHITSLKPIRPENSPDQWEKLTLQKIQNNETNEFSIEQIDDEQYLRKMFPFYVEESCLKCHSKQGYAIGDLRGGISVSVPFAPYQAAKQNAYHRISIVLLSVWILGLSLIFCAYRLVRKQFWIVEEALNVSEMVEKKYRTLFNQAADGICVADIETGEILDCNEGMAALVIRERSDLIGQNMSVFYPPDEDYNVSNDTANFIELNNIGAIDNILEVQLITSAADKRDVQVKVSAHEIAGRKIIQCFYHDITRQKKLQSSAIRSSQLATLGEISAGVAHEINNPVNGVINYAQLVLNRNAVDDSDKDMLQRIISEGSRIAEIVKRLLTFVRNSGEKDFILDFQELIEEPLHLIKYELLKEDISVLVKTQNDLPLIKCNSLQIQQLILNLVNNSRYALNDKFPGQNEDKKIEVSVNLCSHGKGRALKVAVTDYGTGIPDEIISKVTTPFYTTKKNGDGTGLGLGICEEIVHNHGGWLDIESELGKYTRVEVYLPIE